MLRRTRLYTVAGAAQRMDVSEWTIRDWIKFGHLGAYPYRRGPRGERLYREIDLVEAERRNRAGRVRRASVAA